MNYDLLLLFILLYVSLDTNSKLYPFPHRVEQLPCRPILCPVIWRNLMAVRTPRLRQLCKSSRRPDVTTLHRADLVEWEPQSSSGVIMVWYCTFVWLFSLGFRVEGKEPPIVNIPGQGPISGKEVSVVSRSQKANVYLGIPFAQPPKSPRLKPPIMDPLPSWTEVRNSSSFAPACPQDREALREHEYILSQLLSDQIDALEFNEDCLYLNVFVPDGKWTGWLIS